MLSDKTAARDLLEISKRNSIDHVIFSPGSRNTPLIISFANDATFRCISIPDERSAAFFALGLAQQIKKPVILSCTSGSALLNYAPAIVEAYYQKIPLIIVSADRPGEWIDQSDSQTIRQFDIFKNYIKASYELVQESLHDDDLWSNRRKISEAIHLSTNDIPGPVHINVPFREPLYNTVSEENWDFKCISSVATRPIISDEVMEELVQEWKSYDRKLIICGQIAPKNGIAPLLNNILRDETVSVLSETTSNIFGSKFNTSIDRVITTFNQEEASYFSSTLIITMGGALISKKIKALIRRLKPKAHWHVGIEYLYVDIFQSMTRQISISPLSFLKQINPHIESRTSGFQSFWLHRSCLTSQRHAKFMDSCIWSDLKVFDIVLKKLPENSHLHMGNSSPVRYVQLFENREDISYYGNRGVSGIDGCSSTAAGASFANRDIHTLITGDMSFMYDSNAMWNKYLKSNLKFIVINNQGGGIFRIIPGPSESGLLEEFFECDHPFDMEALSRSFGMNYYKAFNPEELEKNLDLLYQTHENDKPSVLEIITPGKENDIILKDYFSFIKQ